MTFYHGKQRKIWKTRSMTRKKVIRKFGRENGHSFGKKPRSEIMGRDKFFRPKLGARSPPLCSSSFPQQNPLPFLCLAPTQYCIRHTLVYDMFDLAPRAP